jgi:hypothetical protein
MANTSVFQLLLSRKVGEKDMGKVPSFNDFSNLAGADFAESEGRHKLPPSMMDRSSSERRAGPISIIMPQLAHTKSLPSSCQTSPSSQTSPSMKQRAHKIHGMDMYEYSELVRSL